MPSGHFVHEQVAALLAVVDGVVHLVGDDLVVFEEAVVGALGEEERREIEGVDEHAAAGVVAEEVSGVVVDDVVPANEAGILDERHQGALVGGMEYGAVGAEGAYVVNLFVVYADFDVDKGVAGCVEGRFPAEAVNDSVPKRHLCG